MKLARKVIEMHEASMKDILKKSDKDSVDKVSSMISDMRSKGKKDKDIESEISKMFPKEYVKMLLAGKSKADVFKAMQKSMPPQFK